MKYSLKPSFTKYFPPSHPQEVAFGYLVHDVSRVFFELLRNLLVVGAVKVIADATESGVIGVIYNISLGMLVLLIYSFITQFDLKIFQHLVEHGFAKVLDWLLSLGLAIASWWASWWLIHFVASEIALTKVHP